MDIRSYFGSTSQASSDAKADSDSEDHGTDSSDPESSPSPPPSKKRVARIKDTTVLYPRSPQAAPGSQCFFSSAK